MDIDIDVNSVVEKLLEELQSKILENIVLQIQLEELKNEKESDDGVERDI